MAEISASLVVKLRQFSGQGMMDCKKALEESGGDIEKAMDILRKKGLATLSKRAEKETSEGLIVSKSSEDGRQAAIASLCSETDFVARSDAFKAAAKTLADYALACANDQGAESIVKTSLGGKSFNDVLAEVVSKTGEKIQVGEYAKFRLGGPGLISTYIHFNDKVGTMVQVDTDSDAVAKSPVMKQAAFDVAMHIAATKPLAIDREGVDQQTIEREKAIYAEQVQGKPAQIVEKIVEGKMKKFYEENCLLEQPFVKDDSKTVGQVLSGAAKDAGGQAKIVHFVRFAVG